MLECALHDVRKYFHVVVRMGPKTPARLNVVFIEHEQVTKSRIVGVVVSIERKGVMALQPVRPRPASLSGRSYFDHLSPPTAEQRIMRLSKWNLQYAE
jgi:hypothetical protein